MNSQAFNFVAVDEEDPELQEDVELTLTILSGGAVVGIETVVIHILPSDLEYPVYDIIQVRDIDNQGVLDSIDTACELRGWCTAGTTTRRGFFTLIDPTSGINVFSAINNFGYEVVEGDSVGCAGGGPIQRPGDAVRGHIDLRRQRIRHTGTGARAGDGRGNRIPSRAPEVRQALDPAQWTNDFPVLRRDGGLRPRPSPNPDRRQHQPFWH